MSQQLSLHALTEGAQVRRYSDGAVGRVREASALRALVEWPEGAAECEQYDHNIVVLVRDAEWPDDFAEDDEEIKELEMEIESLREQIEELKEELSGAKWGTGATSGEAQAAPSAEKQLHQWWQHDPRIRWSACT